MTVERFTIDTNILIYSIDRDAKEKHFSAIKTIEKLLDEDCVLTLQVLCEFYSVATRKKRVPPEDMKMQINNLQTLFPVVTAEPATLQRAMIAVQEHQLSFWDAMLWSTARDAGVNILLTEDFNIGSTIGGIRFENPFIVSASKPIAAA